MREIPIDPEKLDARLFDPAPDEPEDPERERLRAELVEALRELVSTRLTEQQRRIVELYYFAGLSQQDVATALGITQQVVSKQLFGVMRGGKKVGGAIRRLRAVIEELGLEWV